MGEKDLTDPIDKLASMDPSDSMEDTLSAVNKVLDMIDPNSEKANRALSIISQKEERAREYYLRPFDSDEVYNKLIEIHMKRKEYNLVDRYRRCLDLKQARKWTILGDTYQLMGLNTMAAKFLKRALFFGPAEDLVDEVEKTLQKAEKRIAKAEEGLNNAMARYENDPANLKNALNTATFLLDLDRLDEAIKVVEGSLKVNKNDPDLLYRKGVALFGLKDFENARKIFEKLLEVRPNSNNFKRAFNFTMEMT